MAEERETLLMIRNDTIPNSKSNYWIIDALESTTFSWIFIGQSNPWKSALSWLIFFIFTVCVPILSHIVYQCNACDHNHRRPFDLVVQLSLSACSALSFISLSSFARKYGLRRFLFLDKLPDVSVKVRDGYSDQLHRSIKLLCAFIVPCFVADSIYKIWWFTSGGNQIPYMNSNIYISHTIACSLLLCSWLYRTSLFFLVCVLFKLTCSLQILRLQDFAKVFEKQTDVGLILREHLAIRRTLRIISHRFRSFILSTLILVTASQFASLLVTTKTGSLVNISTAGELALCYMTLMDSDMDAGDEDELDNTTMVPIYRDTISYQKRQALATYFENSKSGITVFGVMLDRTSLRMIFAVEMSLTLWLLKKTINFS
ncbi:hypothetical protein SSX86_013031 [Deinandra increscens subsp. villosa]|uniref:Uncharacterized protein n=1 Tax=Deinandra increscens subsp. villosa TaxID=3103831 RepID=A0AAP0D9Q4_9ASTR